MRLDQIVAVGKMLHIYVFVQMKKGADSLKRMQKSYVVGCKVMETQIHNQQVPSNPKWPYFGQKIDKTSILQLHRPATFPSDFFTSDTKMSQSTYCHDCDTF